MKIRAIGVVHTVMILTAVVLTGCASKKKELAEVAKDWCMTIRASQVLPVYPLTEDVRPGDVFAVQTPLSKQVDIYEKKGFLPLDQLVTRLKVSGYDAFYGDAYLKATEGPADGAGAKTKQKPVSGAAAKAKKEPVDDAAAKATKKPAGKTVKAAGKPAGQLARRPANTASLVNAPRAAFPSYTFSVDRGAGLQMAIPIQGVPVGLGIMGASRATGSVTIKDAYTYGIDIESLYRDFTDWWGKNPRLRSTMAAIVQQSNSELYLRVVNRVYLTGGVTVSLTNLDTLAAGADAGKAQEVAIPDLSGQDATQVEASAAAYRASLQALSSPLNKMEGGPGGSFRFAQASQRSVTMEESFDRPLVIGYLGFDMRVWPDGALSPPIPSFSALTSRVKRSSFKPAEVQTFARVYDMLTVTAARRDEVFDAAAKKLGGAFEDVYAMKKTELNMTSEQAFASAKNTYTNDPKLADARLAEINMALEEALNAK